MDDEATVTDGPVAETDARGAPPYDSPVLSEDFLQGDVRRGLERMRLRLLDLTARNRLLHFKASKRTSLRIVDEVPNQLFDQLVDGKELHFAPVPRPKGLLRSGQPGPSSSSRDQPLLGEQLEQERYPTAKEYAEVRGIATSFDLPESPLGELGGRGGRHADRAIQTLHYPEELESKLSSISSAARLATEETGANMLYLAIGFLDWYESPDSTQVRSAPLLLLPVSLRRGAADDRTRTFRYLIAYSGEEIQANVSLQERLRRDFNLDLPDLEEDDTPESYFKKLLPILKHDERWRIKRQMTLTLLAFGKLLMYRDLDPDCWPRGSGPADHPRIEEFFKGIQRDSVAFAEEYPLDSSAMDGRVPLVVDDVDSSQHSALIDAMEGKNLVIEGPPGTGKSQTITNLIAAALVAGKSVLFVSEKLAALQVVRDRLDRIGLGEFCLELHSHKTQKRALLDDVDARIKTLKRHRDPQRLDSLLHVLEDDKRQLTEYAELINRPFGRIGSSLHEIIWSAQRRRCDLPFESELVERILLPEAQEKSTDDIERLRQLMGQLATHLEVVAGAGAGVAGHPWHGLRATGLTFMDEREIVEKLAAFTEMATRLAETSRGQRSSVGDWLGPSPSSMAGGIRNAQKLPTGAADIIPSLLPRLKDPNVAKRVSEFCAAVVRFHGIVASLQRLLGTTQSVTLDRMRMVQALLHDDAVRATRITSVGDVGRFAALFKSTADKLRAARLSLDEISSALNAEVPFTRDGISLILAGLGVVRLCPATDLRYRHDGLLDDAAPAILENAEAEAKSLRKTRETLSEQLDLAMAPSRAELRRYVAATADVRWWSFLSKDFRAAKRARAGMARASVKVKSDRLRADFRALFDFSEREARFRSNRAFRDLGAGFFDGIDTPFGALRRVVEWRVAAQIALANGGAAGQMLFSKLWAAPASHISGLQKADGESERLTKPLVISQVATAEAVTRLVDAELPKGDEKLDDTVDSLEQAGNRLMSIGEQIEATGLPDGLPVSAVPEIVHLLTELSSVEAIITSAKVVEQVLGEQFAGANTRLEPIVRTVRLYDTVVASPAPDVLKRWVIAPAVAERLDAVHKLCIEVSSMLEEYKSRWKAFVDLGSVRWGSWAGSESTIDECPIDAAIARASRALAARETLPAWLDFIRAAAAVREAGLAEVVEMAEKGVLDSPDLGPTFSFIVANSLVQEALRSHPSLARFSGLTHEQVRKHFADLDRETIALYRERAAHKIDERVVPIGNGYGPVSSYTELSLLEREITKQRRHIPLRQLVRRAGRALQALKPCFMMGPLSVAQYLEPGAIEFDIVVMDEASQLRPEDALGSIARARQVIIVGDRMQLPPTSFFDRIGDAEAEEDEAGDADGMTDSESILDVAAATYKPARLLRWHYRSRHASLIAYSNKEFYKGNLITFPSPAPKSPALGVKLIHVKDGVYEDRRNMVEARRAIDTAVHHMRTRPDESLGIVTMNSPQRDLIESLFEQKLKDDPFVQSYVANREGGLEPFFVKNLENVQGDERDVIYISVTYGRAPTGHVYQRFGPINSPTGHRRLNVLFTRARRRLVLFASMHAEDILVQPSSSWGVKALKGYLQFAETGILEQASHTGRAPDSDFEIEVAEALRARGFEVAAQVGVAGYFVDLAVKHPGKTDAFLLGIECDGASYHSSACARDRDRLRQSILEGLGWHIHRIWSTDWFKQPSQEVARVIARIEQLLPLENPLGSQDELEEAIDTGLRGGASEAGPAAVLDALLDDGWEDEESVQPLGVDDARAELVRLRDQMRRDHPVSRDSADLLRDELLEAFLRHRPRDRQEWLKKIPLDLRLDTDGNQLRAYLESVLEITARIAR